jgi:hypothetical protein
MFRGDFCHRGHRGHRAWGAEGIYHEHEVRSLKGETGLPVIWFVFVTRAGLRRDRFVGRGCFFVCFVVEFPLSVFILGVRL